MTPTASAVLSAIPAWWRVQAERAGLAGEWLDVHTAIDITAPILFGEAPPLEEDWGPLTPEQIGMLYVDALDPETRARHGRHYTPAPLARELWEASRVALEMGAAPRLLPGLVRDPACGAGALLLSPIREHVAASRDVDPEFVMSGIANVLEGVDSDPAAVWIANVVLAAELLPVVARIPASRRRPIPSLVRVGDGLDPAVAPARVIVMNPPYGRVRLDKAERERFADAVVGHANLYGMFMAHAAHTLDEHGVLSALVPTSFTAGKYFERLRASLSARTRLHSITFVGDRSGVFTSVLQETCLATFTRRRVRRTTVSHLGSELVRVAKVNTPSGTGPWLLPRRTDLAPVAAAATTLTGSLREFGWRVSTGPLVWNRRRDDLFAHPGLGRYRVVWAADIENGLLGRADSRARHRYFRARDERDTRYLLLESPCILLQRTTAPEQERRVVGVVVTPDHLAAAGGAVVVENHINIVKPRDGQPAVPIELLGRLLATETIDRLVRCVSGSVALSAYELESLRLPDAATVLSWAELSPKAFAQAVAAAYAPESVAN